MKILSITLKPFALIGLGLTAAIILAAGLQAQPVSAQTQGVASVVFTRDLTIGSTGIEVTALQAWLIARDFSIPAGATGYFGGQTQAALARFQASVGITPAAGYFGPITRAYLLATIQTPAPEPADEYEGEDTNENEDDDEDGQDNSASDADEVIDEAEEALADARDEVEEADDDGEDVDDAEDLLEEAEELLDEAQDALADDDYDEAVELAEEAEDLIEDALDEIGANDEDNEDDDSNVSTSEEVSHVNGADNDYATFEIELDLTPFNIDAYIAEDADVSFEYEIQDSDGDAVAGATTMDAYLQSTAEEEGDYFFVEEDESESFTLTVIFDPLAAGEGQLYRLQLLGINFAEEEEAPTDTLDTRPESRYRTDYVLIPD